MRSTFSRSRGVAAAARPGEQIEAYVLRSRDVDVKVFDGEVESLAVSEIEGVGVRVISGLASGLRVGGLARSRCRARDRSRRARQRRVRVARRALRARVSGRLRRRCRPPSTSGATTSSECRPPTRSRSHWSSMRRRARSTLVCAASSRPRTATPRSRARLRPRSASRWCRGAPCARARRTRWPGEGSETRTGSGFSVGRTFADLDVDEAAHDAAERAVRLLGASSRRHGGSRSSSIRWSLVRCSR